MTSHGTSGHGVALLLPSEEDRVAGQMKYERYQTQAEVTFDFGYLPINILN